MKKRKFSIRKTALFLIVLSIIVLSFIVILYFVNIGKVSNDKTIKDFTVETGSNYYSISSDLKKANLIKSEFFYKIYIKLNKPKSITAGVYEFSQSMGVEDIVERLEKADMSKTINLTFREGINISQMGDVIEEKTHITKEEFLNTLRDNNYLNELINKYWFLNENIKDTNIYYSLEGYLYPDTYQIILNQTSIKEIIEKSLDNTSKKLEKYKTQLENNSYSIHQILTLASMVELEAVSLDDRKGVAGVFYNRLNNGWSLGSDVTTYYAAKKKMTDSLTSKELSACNSYNTRCLTFKSLPVGPISNPSIESIDAALNPEKNSYYYFVADINKKVYFSKTASEHELIINKLKKAGLWNA